MQSGSVIWCSRCGVYADKKAKGLTKICNGTPPRQRDKGGMEGQLRKLRNGIHPKTGARLPEAVALDVDMNLVSARGGPREDVREVMPEGFYPYVAVVPPPPVPSDSALTARRWDELKARIRHKELVREMRVHDARLQCRGKYRILVKGAACHGPACCEGA